jgi:hypothetical protein
MSISVSPKAHSDSFELFLVSAIAKAQASAEACVALQRFGEASSCQIPKPTELLEMEEACERWLAERARREERAA